ncbi:MAG: glycosyltransferase family 2 protein [bacterium]
MDLLQYIFGVAQGISLFMVGYLYLLAIVSFWPQKRPKPTHPLKTEFAIIVPAQNEADTISRTLSSIHSLDYPRRLYEVFVIADNCTDETAAVVRGFGVRCFQRWDREKRGKGYALQWAFRKLAEEHVRPDAFLIIDADTLLASDFLKVMNQKILEGEKALQGYYDVLHPEGSIMASLSYFGFALSRHLKFKGRTRLGWTTNLLGNGMCFHRSIIDRFGWPATSIVEDLEYGMMLLLNEVRVAFVPEAKICAEMPSTFKRSKAQRVRWDVGKFSVRNTYLPKLMKAALQRRDLAFFDAAMELLIPPFSLFVAVVVGFFLAFLIVSFKGLDLPFVLWVVIVGALFTYTLLGLAVARASMRMYKNLLYAPYFLLWRVFIAVVGIVTQGKGKWIKTKREKLREPAN